MAYIAVDLGFLLGGSYSIAFATTPNDDILVIVGQSDTGSSGLSSRGFWWTEATGMIDLGVLPGGTFSIATGVSNDGTKVSGQADDSFGFPQPVVWELDIDGNILNMIPIPLLGTGQQGVAYGVSYDGSTVVGFSDTDPYPSTGLNPFSYNGSTTNLGLLAGNTTGVGTCCTLDGATVYGGTVNNTDVPWKATGGGVSAIPLASGELAGLVYACAADGSATTGGSTGAGNQNAFLWKAVGGTILIGAFLGADFSVGYGMSTFGTYIVGDSAATGNHRAFLYDVNDPPGEFEELLPLVGGTQAIARGIAGIDLDNDMMIVGQCTFAGSFHAIYWIQDEPPPPDSPWSDVATCSTALICGFGPVPVFPTLPVGFPVKLSIVMDTTKGKTKSLREVRLPNQEFPLWDLEIVFEGLRDQTQNQVKYFPFIGEQQYEQLVQLWLMMYGQTNVFAFDCPWDNSRNGQQIAVGDGISTTFTIVRTWGLGSTVTSAPIGFINTIEEVIVDGNVVDPGDYTTDRNKITFAIAPGVGEAISMTFSYYYLCRFLEDEQDFEEFGKNRWTVSSLRFRAIIWP